MSHSSLVGGSNAARMLNCPASFKLSKDIPPSPPNEYTREGTALHACMEKYLLEGTLPEEFKGATIESVIIDDTRVGFLEDALAATELLFHQHSTKFYEAEAVVHYNSIPGAFGTADIVGWSHKGLLVGDYKFGQGVLVSPVENSQLKFYAGAVLEDPAFNDFHMKDDTPVTLAIIQPAQGARPITWETTVADIKSHTLALQIATEKAQSDKHTEPNRGDWCKWCPAMATCPAHLKAATAVHRLNDENMLNDLSVAMELADELEPWIRKVRKTVHSQLEAGAKVPGYKLVRAQARRQWLDAEGALTKVRNSKRLLLEDCVDSSLKSVAQLEKVCKAKGVDFDIFDDYYDLVSKGTSVVPSDDPREGVVMSEDREIPEALDDLLNG